MRVTKTLLLAGASLALISVAAHAGTGVDEAKANLRTALQALADARAAAGLPPAPPNGEGAPGGQKGKNQQPPAATGQQGQPATNEATPPAPPPAPSTEQTPPAPATTPPPPPAPTTEQTPPAPQTSGPAPATEQPPAPQSNVPPAPATGAPPAPAGQQGQPPANTQGAGQPPANGQPPVIALPPPPTVTPPPPPPPDATQGTFDFKKFRNKPRFGALPPGTPPAPAQTLPKTEDAVKEGAVIQAPDGRVIVKEGGQVSVIHDDAGRFLQQGGKINSVRSPNGNVTTTVMRPDGSAIVTVRDPSGDILQRYRKKPDGSIEMLIGAGTQTGILDKMLGRGNQPPPPPPPPPPAARLKFGPLKVTIPQQQYIVESSRATPQVLEQTLVAPPVERIERAYSLDEIRRNGRLRDKVRRIDFDTITFDTGQATVPDDQVPTMQAIGTAIRDLVRRDPTQVILIEGHTDAVGSDLSNLALSDRRAETVAEILSYYYGVPAENLVTQGYGEQYLKIPTVAPERQNRRVAFRNITDLLRGQQ